MKNIKCNNQLEPTTYLNSNEYCPQNIGEINMCVLDVMKQISAQCDDFNSDRNFAAASMRFFLELDALPQCRAEMLIIRDLFSFEDCISFELSEYLMEELSNIADFLEENLESLTEGNIDGDLQCRLLARAIRCAIGVLETVLSNIHHFEETNQ